VRVDATEVPVSIGNVRVEPGDWLCGDRDGLVAVPNARIGEVLAVADEIHDAEDQIRAAILAGTPLSEARAAVGYHNLSLSDRARNWTRAVNNIIHAQCRMFPKRFRGVAGLPQYRETSPGNCLEELERCVTELGFVGYLLNLDPTEGDGFPPPGLGDKFFYPLYENGLNP
jgi:predicted TIM-barrel fold metal-dependent hydrolase